MVACVLGPTAAVMSALLYILPVHLPQVHTRHPHTATTQGGWFTPDILTQLLHKVGDHEILR